MDHPIDPRIEIGRVHLQVSDLQRALDFYTGVLGFELTQRMGNSAAFLSAGGYHHHIGLTTENSLDDGPQPPGTTGLYHFAIRYPDRATLGDALRRLIHAKVPLDRASDHGVSEALYLRDPDGNGIELYRDRPRAEWPRGRDGSLEIVARPLDLERLLADAAAPAPRGMSDETRGSLRELRSRLLSLHKVLLDDARVAYEMDRGRIGSSANLLQLVINDPWFAWLHSLSELVVRIDETIEPESPATEADGALLVEQVARLLTVSEEGEGFARRYFEALQRQPAVVMAHSDVRRTLKALR